MILKHPYAYYLSDYLDFVSGHYADITLEVKRRRLNQLKGIIYDLHAQKQISTVSPKLLTADDIVVIIGYRKKRVSVDTVHDDLTTLEGFLKFCGNSAVDKFKTKYPRFIPKTHHKRKPPLTGNQLLHIIERSDGVDSSDHLRMRAYAVVIFSICGGLRNIELKHARVSNLVIDNEGIRLWLDVVKGGDTYGEARWVPLLPFGRNFIERYLESRKIQLDSLGLKSDALIPPLLDNMEFSSDKTLRKLKDYVSKDVGFNFELRACRRTYGQFLVDAEVGFEVVQVAMGHNNPNTTYRNYAGVKTESVPDRVFKQLLNKGKGGE